MRSRTLLVSATAAILAALSLGGCAGRDVLPQGEGLAAFPVPDPAAPVAAYRLGPLDSVSVSVFDEPDLSIQNTAINADGILSFPLLGEVRASGLTTDELAATLRAGLTRYVKRPQVTVTVTASVSQQVTVEGQVAQPGVYPIAGQTTLLKALALARSPTRIGATDEVVVFRVVNGQRMGALFNLDNIRRGRAPDPMIVGNDVVVVGFSALKGAYRDFLQITPALSVFARY